MAIIGLTVGFGTAHEVFANTRSMPNRILDRIHYFHFIGRIDVIFVLFIWSDEL